MAKAARTRISVWLENSGTAGTGTGSGTGAGSGTGTSTGAGAARATRTRRGEQPSGLDRDRITEATAKLLDAEGLAKFSMRRLAGELGVTAMSLYWYVDTKDDLLELALDRVFGEFPDRAAAGGPGPDVGPSWQTELRELAAEYRALLVRHPWVSPLLGNFLNVGPHALRFAAAVQRVMARTGLSPAAQRGAIPSVFQFVYGFGTVEGHFRQRCAEVGMEQDEYFRKAMAEFTMPPEMAETFQHTERVMEEMDSGETVEQIRDRDFRTALDLQIAGIEALVAREPDRG
ncbi:TetR/AcrR family transcriptional regulator [Streptomyces beihaiensis]|uniref:TetR/AcrR family transcriptional regulator n=1 Tax=Streptomyces beihaiensis TaxID=2984495 RepID=A0ABT3U3N3_9ACTN|nr:TetR/AcrR family transcriptional regulator [Streptomyces beihaiensis]MCX3063192.1 TetR/AcrR family transcriptional regulator [Streptomyces beihaiensis]